VAFAPAPELQRCLLRLMHRLFGGILLLQFYQILAHGSGIWTIEGSRELDVDEFPILKV
jgi:hypothetical protein